jgi:dipeptidyl-peptidase-4
MRILSFLFVFSFYSVQAQDITVEKIWKNYEFYPKSIEGFKSMNDGEHFTRPTEDLSIYKYSISNANDKGELLMDGRLMVYQGKQIAFDDYEFNADESKILLLTNVESIYRRSYSAVYYLFDLKTKKLQPLDEVNQPQTLAEYSPDGKSVSYIHGNDLFVKNIESGKVTKLTKDGKRNKIINGTTDWVYEEEFSITKAYGWSPDSKMIAFLRFDEKEVKEFTMEMYGELYPEEYKYKYPKAGEDNSKVTAHVVDVKSEKISNLNYSKKQYMFLKKLISSVTTSSLP